MTIFLKGTAGFFALILLLMAIFLIPPHLQVGRVEPELPDEAALRGFTSAENGPIGIRFISTSDQKLPVGVLGHTVFLIEWADGSLFMIDAGMDRSTANEFGGLMESALGAEAAVFNGTVSDLLGGATQRVTGIGFTHLHIDHTQGIEPFCQARGVGATVFQTSWQAQEHNFNTEEGAAIIADSCLQAEVLNDEAIKTVQGFPGLGVVALGGHTPGSTLFAVEIDGRLWLLSGDTTNTKADLLDNRGKGFLYSYLLVPENTERTEELRLWLAALDANDDITVVVSHDLGELENSGIEEYVR